MCGIVGYIGNMQAAPILLDGLSKLEYRGYDSSGIAVYNGEEIEVVKSKGRLKVLSELTHGGESAAIRVEKDENIVYTENNINAKFYRKEVFQNGENI